MPNPDLPDDSPLLAYARAEYVTSRELAEVEAVLRDWNRTVQYGPGDLTRQNWEARRALLKDRLREQWDETDWCAHRQGDLDLAAQARRQARRPPPRARDPQRLTAGLRTAPCPVQGCGTTVRSAEGTSSQARELPIDPARADQPYTCPCGRRALLTVGLTARRGWVLREFVPDLDARQEMNLIAHALVTGQAVDQAPRTHSRTDLSADPASSRMTQAFMTSHHLWRRAGRLLLLGHLQAARDMAERANAADHVYRQQASQVRRHRREDQRTGRWHGASRFWLEIAVAPHRPGTPLPDAPPHRRFTSGAPPTPAPVHHRFTFEFVAVWNEQAGTHVVANAQEIELVSGLNVGQDGWRQLVALLTRFEAKPGTKADPKTLIYREKPGKLELRAHIPERFPRALVALEALRRTLEQETAGEQEPPSEIWLDEVPDWVFDAIGDSPEDRAIEALDQQLLSD